MNKIPFYLKASLGFFFVFMMSDQLIPQLQFFRPLRFIVVAFLVIWSINIHKKSPLVLAALPFTVWTVTITIMYSPILSQSLPRSFGFLMMTWCIFNYIRVSYERDEEKFAKVYFKALILIFGLSFLLLLSPLRSYVTLVGRFRGIFGNPNGLGLFCLVSYPLIDLFVSRGLKLEKKQINLLRLFFIVSIILCGSRTAFACILIYEFFKFTQKKKSYFILSLLSLGLFAAFYSSIDFKDLVYQFNLQDYVRIETLETASGRSEVWDVAKEEIKKQPWTGKGMMYEKSFILAYRDFYDLKERHWSGIWSSYYSGLLNIGYIGMSLLFFFWFKLYQASTEKKLATAYIIAILFSGITESWFMASMNSFTPFFLLYFAIQSVKASTHSNTLNKVTPPDSPTYEN